MDLPHAQLLAPSAAAQSVASIPPTATTAAVFGRAADIGALPTRDALRSLWISGMSRNAVAAVAHLHRLEHLVMHDYRLPDLTPLRPLGGLRSLAIAGSPRLKQLTGLETLSGLEELILFGCNHIADLQPLTHLTQLHTLCLEGSFSTQLRLASCRPLASLPNLQHLRLASVRVGDGLLTPLLACTKLQSLFLDRSLPFGERATLAAAWPRFRTQLLDDSSGAG